MNTNLSVPAKKVLETISSRDDFSTAAEICAANPTLTRGDVNNAINRLLALNLIFVHDTVPIAGRMSRRFGRVG